jgi:hypothetical protein
MMWLVWCPGDCQTSADAKRVAASSPGEAAEAWGKWADFSSDKYGGMNRTVHVHRVDGLLAVTDVVPDARANAGAVPAARRILRGLRPLPGMPAPMP